MRHVINDTKLTVFILSDITSQNTDQYRKLLMELVEQYSNDNIKRIELDLSDVSMIDSSGVSVIVGLYKTVSAQNIGFCIINMNEKIQKLFRLLKFERFFKFE